MSTTATPLVLPGTVTVRSEEVIAVLGLVEAYGTVCAEFAGQHREAFDFASGDLPPWRFPPLDPHEDGVFDFVAGAVSDASDRYEPRIRELLARNGDPIGELRFQVRLLAEKVLGVEWDDGWRPLTVAKVRPKSTDCSLKGGQAHD